MVSSNESALASIESEVRANLASPRPDTLAFLNEALRRLKSVPLVVDPGRRIDCLLAVAQQFHHQGQSTFSAVEPVALAVMLAREVADKPLLRRALNLQGIVLSATNNPGDALRSLVEALEIAEELGDRAGLASVWINIGAAFYEAALYSDSQASLQRASTIAIGMSELRNLRSMLLRTPPYAAFTPITTRRVSS